MDTYNPNRITSDDFKTGNFDYMTIYNKICNLIELGEVKIENCINDLKFHPKSLKKDFYDSVQIFF